MENLVGQNAPNHPPPQGFDGLVVFGDSLSDMGTYTGQAVKVYGLGTNAATAFRGLPYASGGQFTVNEPYSFVWPERVAHMLHLTLHPNVITYGTGTSTTYLLRSGHLTHRRSFCTFSTPLPSGKPDCLDFAEGGARIAKNARLADNGAPALPVSRQVTDYLAQFGRFDDRQLVILFAGNNDVLAAFKNFLLELSNTVQQDVSHALILDPGAGPVEQQAAGTRALLNAYQISLHHAMTSMDQAADNATAIARRIVHHGARYLMVYTLPDMARTPFGLGLPYTLHTMPHSIPEGHECDRQNATSSCHVLSLLIDRFNQRLLLGLQHSSAKVVDAHELFNRVLDEPSFYGFTDVKNPWCSPALPDVLFCNLNTPNTASGATPDNLSHWLFADLIHPTPEGHQRLASFTIQSMRTFGWLAP